MTRFRACTRLTTSWDHEGQGTGRQGLGDFARDFLFLCVF